MGWPIPVGCWGHYLMDHHGNIGGSGTFEGGEDRIYKGFRPAMIAMPRFRNVGKQETDFLRGYGIWGGAHRVGLNPAQVGIGAQLKQQLSQYGPWKMSLGCQSETLPYVENRVEIDENNLDQWGFPRLKITAAYGENEKLMQQDIKQQIAEMLEVAGLKDINVYESKAVFWRYGA